MSRHSHQSSIFGSCIVLSFLVSIVHCAHAFLPLPYMRSLSEYEIGNSDKSGSCKAVVEATTVPPVEGHGVHMDSLKIPLPYMRSSSKSYGVGSADKSGDYNANFETTMIPPADVYRFFSDLLNALVPQTFIRSSSETYGMTNKDKSCGCNTNIETTMIPPAEGYGFFKDPIEVLGPRFPRSCMVSICENYVQLRSDNVVSGVKFTRRGARTCSDVCAQYRMNMMKNHTDVAVHSWPGYCDITGATDQPTGTQDLSTACICAYKVRCDRRTELLLYSFETDIEGNVRVSVTESDRKHYVTAYLLSDYLRRLNDRRPQQWL